MIRWFSRTKKDSAPSYSLLKAALTRGLPRELADQEASADFREWRDRIESDLFSQSDEDAPWFLTLLTTGNGFLQLRLEELEGGCLLIFSTPLRAAEYASVAAPKQKFKYFCPSREKFLSFLRDCQQAGVTDITLDRCPRCKEFMTIKAASLNSAVKVIEFCRIAKATEIARCSLYFDYARSAAKNGQFLCARDVVLELVGHVTSEDPRSHLLLGKLAICLHDKQLLREAKDFLAVTKQDWAVSELQSAEKTKVFEF